MSNYSAYLRGINFRPIEARQAAAALEVGAVLELTREPFNPHDPNAIMVSIDDTHIGYVAKEIAVEIAPEMDSGMTAVCTVTDIMLPKSFILEITTS